MAGMPSFNIDSIVNAVLKMNGDDADPSREFDVAILIDESVSPELVSYARKAFQPSTGSAVMHVESYYDEVVEVSEAVDILVIIANASPWTGACYEIATSRNIPTIVVAEKLSNVIRASEEMHFPIDYGDLLAPEAIGMSALPVNDFVRKATDLCMDVADSAADLIGRKIPERLFGRPIIAKEAIVSSALGRKELVGDEVYDKLFDQLADWVMVNCESIRSAFARAFSFAKASEVDQIARRTAYENAVTGAVFFIPGADFPVMTLNQLKMLVMIERSYGFGLDKQTIAEAVAVVAGALAARTIVRSLCRRIPALSWLVKTASGYFVTIIMGRIIRNYCDKGRQLPAPIAKRLGTSTGEPAELSAVARVDNN